MITKFKNFINESNDDKYYYRDFSYYIRVNEKELKEKFYNKDLKETIEDSLLDAKDLDANIDIAYYFVYNDIISIKTRVLISLKVEDSYSFDNLESKLLSKLSSINISFKDMINRVSEFFSEDIKYDQSGIEIDKTSEESFVNYWVTFNHDIDQSVFQTEYKKWDDKEPKKHAY